jgi:hypothetical protein
MALGRADKDIYVRVTGKVRLVGNDPVSELVISGSEREWYVEKAGQKKLMDFQQQIVTVQGVETAEELTFGNGKSAGIRYTLKNIKILKKP